MNPLHTHDRSTLPLTASARDALALFKTLDANDDDHPTESSQAGSSATPPGPSQLPRQDSPYVNAVPLLAPTKASISSSTSRRGGRRPTFKPLLPRSRGQPSDALHVTTSNSSPPVNTDAVQDKAQAVCVRSGSTSPRQATVLHVVKSNLNRTVPAREYSLQSIRAVPLRRTRTGVSHDDPSQLLRPQPSSSGSEHAQDLIQSASIQNTAGARQISEDLGVVFDESVLSVPSSRTPSLNELKGGDIDLSKLHIKGGGRQVTINHSEVSARERSTANDLAHRLTTSKRKRAVKQKETLKPTSEVHLNIAVSGLQSDADQDYSPEKGKNKKKRKNSTLVPKATTSKPKPKSARPVRGSKTRNADAKPEAVEKMTLENGEAFDSKPSALVASLPKRKAARKVGHTMGAAASTADDDHSLDDTSQYHRENWESSASSSQDDGHDETDYDDGEVITGIK